MVGSTKITRFVAFSCVVLLMTGSLARAADEEMVENPVYASWAKHKPGTTVTGTMKATVGGQEITSDLSSKLLEVTPEKVVVEETRKTNVPGANIPAAVTKEEIQAKIKKSEVETAAFGPDMKAKVKDAGTEKLEIDGKSYECKVREFTSEEENFKMAGKTWESADVPGTNVKMESTGSTPGGPMKMTITLTKVELK